MNRRFTVLALALAALAASPGCAPSLGKCEAPRTACSSSSCADLATDPEHCGTCDVSCSAGQSCVAGKCECPSGTTACGGVCVVTATDAANCGTCGKVCATGLTCIAGQCLCPPDTLLCGGVCVDARNDPKHCGLCDKVCAADQVCSGSSCTCPNGGTFCDGKCVDARSDPKNCGACGKQCEQRCQDSTCVADCTGGTTDCGGACVDLQTDERNCQACGKQCVGEESCTASGCSCPTGQTLCNGKCVDLTTDVKNCQACGKACIGEQLCTASVCGCPTGETLCGTQCIDLQADPLNCGGCGKPCQQGQSCFEGFCASTVWATCFSGGHLVGLDDDLKPQASRAEGIGGGPQSIAFHAASKTLLIGDGMDNVIYSYDATKAPATRVSGGDTASSMLNQVLTSGDQGIVVSSGANLIQRLDLTKPVPTKADTSRTVSPDTALGANTNPYLATVVGTRLYVTLYGNCMAPTDTSGNRLVEVNLLTGLKGRELVFDAAAYEKNTGVAANAPRPAGVAAVGTKVFVAIGNLTPNCAGPAGPGYLAVVETSATDLVPGNPIKLPAECTNPGFVLASGGRLYVSCGGSWGYGTSGEALAVVDAATEKVLKTTTFARCQNPAEKGPNACKTVVPGRLALHGNRVLIADSNAGRLLATDLDGTPVAGLEQGVTLCPLSCPSGDTGTCFQMVSDVHALR